MKRQWALFRHSLGSLARRARRSAALTAGLAFTVALFSAVWMLSAALRTELRTLADTAPHLTVQRLSGGRPALLPQALADELRTLPAVRAVTPRVWGYVYLGVLDANLTIVGADPASAARLGGKAVERAPGAPPAPGGATMWMGHELVRILGLRLGDKFALPSDQGPLVLTLTGVFDAASAVRTADVVLVDPTTAGALLEMPADAATDFAIELSQPLEAQVVADKIRERLPGRIRVLERDQLARAYGQSFGARSGLMMAGLLPALASLLLIAFDRLTGLSEEERREVGVLRASGFLTGDILAVRMWESLAISLAGAVLGLVVAYVFVFLLGAPVLREVLFGYSTLYPPLRLTPPLDPGQALSVIALVSVPFTAVSLVPAWRVAMLDPALTLRGDE